MNKRRVFIVGNSLFAETLALILAKAEAIDVTGTSPTLNEALPLLQTSCPDALIVAETALHQETKDITKFLRLQPDLPLILADLDAKTVQVITSQQVYARTSDVLAVIASLPSRYDPSAVGVRSQPARSLTLGEGKNP
jgi:hypothetical protein